MRARKVDANHAAVRTAFRALGCSVLDTFTLGQGAPDMICAKGGRTWSVEVKDGAKPPSKRRLTLDQEQFRHHWQGELAVVETLADVPRVVAWMTRETR